MIDVRNVTELNRVGQIQGSECLPLHQINLGFELTDEQFASRYGFLKPDSAKRHIIIRTSYLAYLLIHRELKLVGRCTTLEVNVSRCTKLIWASNLLMNNLLPATDSAKRHRMIRTSYLAYFRVCVKYIVGKIGTK